MIVSSSCLFSTHSPLTGGFSFSERILILWGPFSCQAATRCNTLQHAATRCNTLPHTSTQHAATRCNALPHTSTHCDMLQRTTTHCSAPRCSATHCNTLQHTATHRNTPQHTATHRNTPQHTATHRNTQDADRGDDACETKGPYSLSSSPYLVYCALNPDKPALYPVQREPYIVYNFTHRPRHMESMQRTATRYNTLQHTATHCNTLQHTATHCNTLQHTATHCNTPTKTSQTLSREEPTYIKHLVFPGSPHLGLCMCVTQPMLAVVVCP